MNKIQLKQLIKEIFGENRTVKMTETISAKLRVAQQESGLQAPKEMIFIFPLSYGLACPSELLGFKCIEAPCISTITLGFPGTISDKYYNFTRIFEETAKHDKL